MKHIPVDSSNVYSIGFQPHTLEAKSILEVTFKDKNNQPVGTYQYPDVPEQMYRDMLNSASKGKYFRNNILPHFPAKKCDGTHVPKPEQAEREGSHV